MIVGIKSDGCEIEVVVEVEVEVAAVEGGDGEDGGGGGPVEVVDVACRGVVGGRIPERASE